MLLFSAGKTTEINESAHAYFTKPLTIASMIALQVSVRKSCGFHLRDFTRASSNQKETVRQ